MSSSTKAFKLRKPRQYHKWKYLLEEKWRLDEIKRSILDDDLELDDLEKRLKDSEESSKNKTATKKILKA